MFADVFKGREKAVKVQSRSPSLRRFLEKYDDEKQALQFDTLKFRAGAKVTAPFGITQGYRKVDNEIRWDSIRIHTGVDRAATTGYNGTVQNVIYAPFDFQVSVFHNYGLKNPYGSLLRLINTEYGFEFRIAHIHPDNDLDSDAAKILKGEGFVRRNTYLGKAGQYGFSYGPHTHTELVSTGQTTEVFDELLDVKFGTKANQTFTEDDIVDRYAKSCSVDGCNYLTDREDYLAHYQVAADKRRIVGCFNDYKMEFSDWFKDYDTATRYSTELLFNGL